MLLLVIPKVWISPSLVPGLGKDIFVVANLASSIVVVFVERRVDSSWKVVGMTLGMHLHSDA